MANPNADVRLGDVYDFEGDLFSPRRHFDTVAVPAMELGLAGIAQLRKALDEGEAGIRGYLARAAGQDDQREPGADLPESCAYHGGEGDGGEFCDGCREDRPACTPWQDCGCGLGADRCRRAEDGDFGD